MGFAERRKRLLRNAKAGCAIVTGHADMLYYTGYSAGSGFIIIHRDGGATLLAGMVDNEAESVRGLSFEPVSGLKDVRKYVGGSAAFNEDSMEAGTMLRLKRAGIALKPSSKAFSLTRAVKDGGELERIAEAVRITKHAFGLEPYGKSEARFAKEIVQNLISRGSDAELAFGPIAATGPNSYFIHHRPAGSVIRRGRLLVQDCGARFMGYCADVTRTRFDGCGSRELDIVEDVLDIKAEVTENAMAGSGMKELNQLYKNLMAKKRRRVFHGIGHGLGLDVHESIPGRLEKGMVITAEPGIYERKTGGCRFEDMLLITRGKPKVLSRTIPCP